MDIAKRTTQNGHRYKVKKHQRGTSVRYYRGIPVLG